MSAPKTRVVEWKLSRLKPHPRQAAVFGDLPEARLAELTDDMRARGQQVPVEVLPDGTIVAGHQRVLAARRLGWTEIDVVVRHDLAADAAAATVHFIKDNLVRRQLSPLAVAKCIKELLAIEQGVWAGKEELKEEIGRRLKMSGRTVNRYLAVLATPPEVQAAFDAGDLSLTAAGRVAQLGGFDQRQVVRRIRAGEPVAAVVDEVLTAHRPARGNALKAAGPAFLRLVTALSHETPNLKGRARRIGGGRLRQHLPVLLEAEALLVEVLDEARRLGA